MILTSLQPLPVLGFQIVNAIGDLLDLLSALQPQSRVNWRAMNQTQFEVLRRETDRQKVSER